MLVQVSKLYTPLIFEAFQVHYERSVGACARSLHGKNEYLIHYVRNTQSRRACMKNRDAQITYLRCHVSHYRIIRDARLESSPISIHWRHN
jgi:hypothetical protein